MGAFRLPGWFSTSQRLVAVFTRFEDLTSPRLDRSRRRIASHDTFGRVFSRLDPAELLARTQQRLNDIAPEFGKHIAIDGETLRGSFHKAAVSSEAMMSIRPSPRTANPIRRESHWPMRISWKPDVGSR